ncbi:hypothetical protein HER15_10790 [Tenacibaculum mesophilum]|uniref:Lipocalin-like domain-containing protein n=1 Tax=Tenacibaculum mesophilum TaxID=104268 RepID=A0AAE9SFU5_9FLAO|nr:hypothetical protein [Tenacibaculum mesophilum]UTD15927.1 hypothetical protein HER15_10790 [Tenacibaculum mesophilum]
MKNFFKISYVTLVCLTLVMTGCSDDDNTDNIGTPIPNTILKGKVYGKDFTAKGGKSFASGKDGEVSINITNEEVGCDSDIFDYKLEVSLLVEGKVGTYNDVNVVFKDGEGNLVNVLGSNVEVVSISDSKINLKIEAKSIDKQNKVSGSFEVEYCK